MKLLHPSLAALQAVLLAAGLSWAAPVQAGVVDRVAAVVNDDVVTLSEVYELGQDFIDQRAAKGERRAAELEVLETLVQRRLIGQEIERLGIDVTDVDVDRAIDDIARRNDLEREDLRTEVEKSGMAWTQYRAELRESLREQQFTSYITQTRISVDEDELRDAYRRTVAELPQELVVDLGAFVLLFPEDADGATQAEVYANAQDAAARVNAGEDFATVAREIDQGAFGAQDGKMGTYKRGELVEQLEEPAFETPVGQASPPVVTPRGVFVLFPFERGVVEPPAFEEMRDELQNRVYADRIEDEIDQWYQSARRQSAVEIKLRE